MFKKIIIYSLIFLLIFTNSVISSNTFKTLESYYYILAFGIDYEDSNYKLTIQILEPSPSSSGPSEEKPILYSKTGSSFEECINNLEKSLSRTINLSHTSTIFLSKKLLEEKNINEIISSLGNNTELRSNTFILISNNSAEETLKTISNTNETFTPKIYQKIIDSTFDVSHKNLCTFGTLFKSVKNNNTPILIPLFEIINENNYFINNLALINNGKYISSISNLEHSYYHLLTNSIQKENINFINPNNPNEYINLDMEKYKNTTTKISFVNSSPFVSIKLYPQFIIKSSGEHYNYLSNNNIKSLEQDLNKYLSENITHFLYKTYMINNSDLLNISKKFKSKVLTLEDYNSYQINKLYQNTIFKVEVNSQIISSALFNKQ